MEKSLEFNSQICTTREQSEKLLALGLKKETAEMWHVAKIKDWRGNDIPKRNQKWWLSFDGFGVGVGFDQFESVPAWSLHRLIELMPEVIFDALLCVFKDSIRYEALVFDRIEVLNDVVSDNIYDNAIATIEWLIKEGYFNQDYLEEKK